MKKKAFGTIAIAAASVLCLASCGQESAGTQATYGNLNIYLNYSGQNGVSYRGTQSYENPLDNLTYVEGDILPTWKAFAKNVGVNITDVASYSDTTDDASYTTVLANGFKGAANQDIDLFYNKTANITKMANAGNAVDLYPYLVAGKMPNLAQYLSDNPEVFNMIATYDDADSNGYKKPHFYYTPYFDGYQQVERMFIMDTEMVENLLDETTNGDSDTAIGTGRLGEINYKPFIDAENNYPQDDTKVTVALSAETTGTVNVNQTTNIIKQQNSELANNPNATGDTLLKQFRAYLTAAYGESYGADKDSKLSDIFVGQNACYNADDLIALMRVVRANPKKATGNKNCTTVEVLFPRGQAANRMENIYDFASIWGLQGVDGESGNFYFDGQGKLVNLSGTQAAYDALELLHDIYKEGLIVSSFYEMNNGKLDTFYTDSYFSNTATNAGAGFMMYDYCASTTVGNDTDSKGVGTSVTNRKGVYSGLSRQGIRPVLQPLTYWCTGSSKYDESLYTANGSYNSNRSSEMTLMRYAESNRALKNTSWCIPTNAQNKEGAIKLMDYLYSAEGSRINDFGPIEFQGETSTSVISGQYVPTLSTNLINAYLDSGKDFWSYMRQYIGSTNGMAGIRSDALDMQATNEYAQVGLTYLQNAIRLKVVTLANCTTSEFYGFGACVPASWSVSENTSAKTDYKILTDFWSASGTGESQWRKIVTQGSGTNNDIVVNESTKLSDIIAKTGDYNTKYVSIFSSSINATPSWLTELIN